jgi:hypothetical protein
MSPSEEQLLAVQPEPSQIEDGVGVVRQDGVAVVVPARPERHNALIGLVQRVVEPGESLGHTARLVGQICAGSGVTMRAAKAGVAAFVEGHEPRFAREQRG